MRWEDVRISRMTGTGIVVTMRFVIASLRIAAKIVVIASPRMSLLRKKVRHCEPAQRLGEEFMFLFSPVKTGLLRPNAARARNDEPFFATTTCASSLVLNSTNMVLYSQIIITFRLKNPCYVSAS